jgi:lipid-A-disaccharide synthase
MTRLFLVAGEASGDLQGSLLARALREIEPGVVLTGVGGSRMAEEGVHLLADCGEMGVTGLWEVLRDLPKLRRLLARLGAYLKRERPDAFIPIDYPDFNLRLAASARAAGVPVLYYISPQVWAWRRGRIETLKRLVRRMIVIFPFEEEIYRDAGIPVSYVGHPLVDQIRPSIGREAMRATLGIAPGEILVGLLPGSRRSEIERILPVLCETRRRLAREPGLRWVLALAPGFRETALPGVGTLDPGIAVRQGEAREILGACDLALTASGTATLEGALLGCPMIVLYKMHPLTWFLARRLVRIPHIAMANLLAGERIVPEYLQGDANAGTLAAEVLRWARDAGLRAKTRERLLAAAGRLGPGGAAGRAARVILDEVRAQ